MTVVIIRCRARISKVCQDGVPGLMATGDPDYRNEDDGTWNGHTIVCTNCYVELMPLTPSGAALLDELPLAIAVARDIKSPMLERVDRFTTEAIEAGFTPTAAPVPGSGDLDVDGGFRQWLCTVYERDGEIKDQIIIEVGKPPRRSDART